MLAGGGPHWVSLQPFAHLSPGTIFLVRVWGDGWCVCRGSGYNMDMWAGPLQGLSELQPCLVVSPPDSRSIVVCK